MNQIFLDRVDNAMKRCDGQVIEECRGFFGRIYPFTTENINGYLDVFDLENHSLLTVGSSGDQVLNAILKGCRDIQVIDINPYTKYYYYLKAAGVITLNYEDFFLFFRFKDYPTAFQDNSKVFSQDLYHKIAPVLKKLDFESYLFWEKLFHTFSPQDIRRYLFQIDEEKSQTIKTCNFYLQTKNHYHNLKKILATITPSFINHSIFTYSFSQSYDNIWLSNIGSYLTKEEIQLLPSILEKGLSPSGKMLASYLYYTKENPEYRESWGPIYNIEEVKNSFSNDNLEQLFFLGVKGIISNKNEIKDSILLCSKKKKTKKLTIDKNTDNDYN